MGLWCKTATKTDHFDLFGSMFLHVQGHGLFDTCEVGAGSLHSLHGVFDHGRIIALQLYRRSFAGGEGFQVPHLAAKPDFDLKRH